MLVSWTLIAIALSIYMHSLSMMQVTHIAFHKNKTIQQRNARSAKSFPITSYQQGQSKEKQQATSHGSVFSKTGLTLDFCWNHYSQEICNEFGHSLLKFSFQQSLMKEKDGLSHLTLPTTKMIQKLVAIRPNPVINSNQFWTKLKMVTLWFWFIKWRKVLNCIFHSESSMFPSTWIKKCKCLESCVLQQMFDKIPSFEETKFDV